MVIRRRVLVAGRVQGVFFRHSCRREATGRQVGGWVRNLPDGRVEAVFEGQPAAVEAMVAWCASGPPSAEVADIHVAEERPEGATDFRVR